MTADPCGADDLVRRGRLDLESPDALDRAELLRYAFELGVSDADVRAAKNIGELAPRLKLRPRGTATLRAVVAPGWASRAGHGRDLASVRAAAGGAFTFTPGGDVDLTGLPGTTAVFHLAAR